MRELAYRILNVFTIEGDRLSGNPLAVFEDGSALSDAEMQALARQFNLSETTFVLPASSPEATARVRIFTPSFEMPFAGHPTLGTSYVVRDLFQPAADIVLEMKVGLVHVSAKGDRFQLRTAKVPEERTVSSTNEEVAAMLGLAGSPIAGKPLWVDTGAEQLVIPLASEADVAAARPNAELLAKHGRSEKRGVCMAYVWAKTGADTVTARFFFLVNGGVVEDPATGSACANLGGYLVLTGHPLPVAWRVSQGSAIARPSLLHLDVSTERAVHVGGSVVELGRGKLGI